MERSLTQLPSYRWIMAVVVVATMAVNGLAAQEKSPGTAFAWSLLGTLVPSTVGYNLAATGANHLPETMLWLAGVYVGPGLGHIYAEQSERAFTGMGIRAGITLGAFAGFYAAGFCLEACTPGEETAATVIFLLGGLGMVASTAIDIIAAPGSARRTNRERGFSLAPTVLLSRDRLGLGFRFVY